MRTAADLRRAARAAGLDIESIERVPVPGAPGETTLSARMVAKDDDPWAAARLLTLLAEEDAADPVVRAWSLGILAASSALNEIPSGPVVTPELRESFGRSVQRNVQQQIRFVREPRETFQSARVTMRAKAGDCDDHARLVHALNRAAGARSRLLYFVKDGQPVHVAPQVHLGSAGWQWQETTIPARFGEHPRSAFTRLMREGKLPKGAR